MRNLETVRDKVYALCALYVTSERNVLVLPKKATKEINTKITACDKVKKR